MKAYRYFLYKRYISGIDFTDEYYSRPYLEKQLIEYDIISETPKGFWIFDTKANKKRFVLNVSHRNHRKYFAHKDKDAAFKAMLLRKEAHLWYLKGQIMLMEDFLSPYNKLLNYNTIQS